MKCDKLIYKQLYYKDADGRIMTELDHKRKLEEQLRKQKIIFFEMLSNYAHWKAKALWLWFSHIEKAERKERQEKLFKQIADKLKKKKP